MNEQRFSLPGRTENPEGPKQPEEERAKQETPESATEQKEQEGGFESRYENLANEWNAIKRDREVTFQVAHMQSEGLQTLISEYGSDAVFDAIKKQFETKTEGSTFSTFEVVRVLEADPKKRAELFEKIKTDAQQEGEKFDKAVNPTLTGDERWNSEPRWYFDSHWGGGKNFALGAKFRADAMQALDSVFGKIAPQRHYKILDSRMHEFATYVSQFEEEEQKLKGQLAEAGNDIFRLVEDRDKNSEERTEQLRSQADKLHEELTKEVERITQELNTKLEEWRAKVVGDLSKVGSLDTASEEMKTALQGVLEKVETEIADHVKRTEQEIADKTAPLRKLMSGVEGLHRSY